LYISDIHSFAKNAHVHSNFIEFRKNIQFSFKV
jgi:hypothetical protein